MYPASPPPPASVEYAFTLEIIRCTFDKEFSACVKQGRKIPTALASNNCSRTQALKYSTEVTRKESPAAVKNDRSLPPFTQHINLQIPRRYGTGQYNRNYIVYLEPKAFL